MSRRQLRFALIVTNLAGGGAEKAMLNVATLLAARGSSVDMVLLEDKRDHEMPAGVQTVLVTPAGRSVSHGLIGTRHAAWRLRRLLNAGKGYDLIVSTLPFADEVALQAQLPRHWCRIANTLSAEVATLAQHDVRKSQRRARRYQRNYRGRRLIAVSDGVASDLTGPLRIEGARIETIVNPFDFAAIRAAAKQRVPLPEEPYALHVGRFIGQKRHDLLLAAWSRLPQAPRLVLLTAPDPGLSALVDRFGLRARVTVAGFQANPYPWMARARLLVLSSDHEGMPNVLVEALACGTPVLSTDCPSGPREILGRDAPRCLVPVNDAQALASGIARSLTDPVDPAKVDLSRFDHQAVAGHYERLAAEP